MLKTGDTVRLLQAIDLSTAAHTILVPADTVGAVIEDLNEVVAKDNTRLPPHARDTRPRDLALVRFAEYDAQGWLRYSEVAACANQN